MALDQLLEKLNKQLDTDGTYKYHPVYKYDYLDLAHCHARKWREREPEKFRDVTTELLRRGLREIDDFGWMGKENLTHILSRYCEEHFKRNWEESNELADLVGEVLRPPRGRPRGSGHEYPVEEWRRMRKEGLSIREIARRTGYPKSTVHDALSGRK